MIIIKMTTQTNQIIIQIIETKIIGITKYTIYSNLFESNNSNSIVETDDYKYTINYFCNYINSILYKYNYILLLTNKSKYYNDITEYYYNNTKDETIYSKLIYIDYTADNSKHNSLELIQTKLNELKTEFIQYELYSNLSGLSINNCIIGNSKNKTNAPKSYISNIVQNIFKQTQQTTNQQTTTTNPDPLEQLNQNITTINNKIISLFPESITIIQDKLIELPKPYKFISD